MNAVRPTRHWLLVWAAICLIQWIAVPAGVAAGDKHKKLPANWDTYTNDRFGQTVDYPKDIFVVQDPPPTNGDGARFHSKDGKASFTASGSHNAFDPPLALNGEGDASLEAFEEGATKQDGWKVSYRRKGKDFLVLSGTRGDRIFYEKTMLVDKDQIMVTLWIEYPAAEKAAFDKVVPKMAASFDSDGGSEGSSTGSAPTN